ncbi:serine/threonine-protein kinase [Streptacidiphilus jiangxiensis]|uniref:non-specific serine/threonine protein kinase n=1 Tax=Streptacidiphilus jiangxiensis TaxID=235985 RepID=A0A1H7X7F8_STRJI|nr:serine/threonine-protein kinase [Streptacidiphilus jiangxiensis]SEM29631.1 Serine/threonine protein kinase [Streptacidiphilus jiangxiensis]
MAQEAQAEQLIAGRYRLLSKLGAGGFGEVWKAHDETLRLDVAVKAVRVPPAVSTEEQAERLARAAREARNAARLRDHPNVVAVHDVVIDSGVPWTVMQLVVGSSLQEQLDAHGALSVDRAAALASAMLGALGAAHDCGIVHRDVKPANVMVAGERFLLTDFGIAVHEQDTALTGTGMLIGSAEYMAPERARGQDGLAASDLFSLGVMLYQAVEGVSPFRRATFEATLAAVLFEGAPPMQNAGQLTDLIAGLMAKSLDRRPTMATARVLLHAASGRARFPRGRNGGPDLTTDRHERAVAALAKAGRLARGGPEDLDKAWGLCRVAQVAAVLDADLARQFADEAECVVRNLPPDEDMYDAWLLAEVAKGLAGVDPGRAVRLAGEAESIADSLPKSADRALGLAEVAKSLTDIDPARIRRLTEAVERTARTVPDRFRAAEALNTAADALAELDPGRAARLRARAVQVVLVIPVDPPEEEDEDLARAASGRGNRVKALSEVACQWSGTDPSRAQQLIGEAEHTAEKMFTRSARAEACADIGDAQARIAQQLAGTDPALALGWVDRTAGLARSMPDGPSKQRLLGARATALAVVATAVALDRPDHAVALATEALDLTQDISTDPELESAVGALTAVAEVLALTDPDRALDLLGRTRPLADGLSTAAVQGRVLGQVVRAMTAMALHAVGDPDRAEQALRAAEGCIDDMPHGETARPKHEVVEAMAQTVGWLVAEHREPARSLVKRAQRLARGISPSGWRDQAWVHALVALAAVDPDKAERATRDLSDRDDKVTVWIAAAKSWTAAP